MRRILLCSFVFYIVFETSGSAFAQIPDNIASNSQANGHADPMATAIAATSQVSRRDLVGSWSSGVWSLNSSTGEWTNLTTSVASQIATGDVDGDGIDDLVGVFPGSGLWVKHSSAGAWQFVSSAPTALAVGDTNGDHKAEIVGVWDSVVWSRDGASSSWTSLTNGASQIVLGDMDGDGKDDLIGVWSSSGVWVKFTSTGVWTKLTSSPGTIACGDLNRDGKTDLLGIWGGVVWAMDSATGSWASLTAGVSQITAGDLDGDGKDDLIGIWPDSGVWVKYSSTGAWSSPSTSVPQSITTARQPASNAGCPPPNGLSIDHHSDITTNQTWAGDGTLHKVSNDITIRPGATLTLAACAVVQVASGRSLTLRGDGSNGAKFVSAGTAGKPVLITNSPGSGKWGYLRSYTPDSFADLSYTTLENGGSATLHGASLDFNGSADPSSVVVPMVRADHLVVKNSAGTGIVMEGGAGFTADSTDITVTGGGNAPGGNGDSAIEMSQLAVSTLPTLHISGNAHDQIRISSGGTNVYISRDLTIKNLGVPYYFYYERVRVADPAGVFTPTLTVQPGVELRFDNYLMIGEVIAGFPDRPGRLLALGTAAQPILFTSSKTAKAAGDWPGVWLRSAAGSRIENARIEFAGGWNGIVSANCRPVVSNDWAGLFIGWAGYVPSPSDFVNVTIANSASHGINAMWTAATQGPDLTGAFTFQNINGCRQTKNGIAVGCGANGTGCLVP